MRKASRPDVRPKNVLYAKRQPARLPKPASRSWKPASASAETPERYALALLQVQRVAGEYLLRAHLARQDFLTLRKLNHSLDCLAVACQAIGQWVISHQAAALRQGLSFARQSGP